MKKERKYLPGIGELIDRLSIDQLKEVFLKEKEHYKSEMKDIMEDLDILLKNKKITAKLIRAIIAVSQLNTHIWYNERDARAEGTCEGKRLLLTHGLNGSRNRMKNIICDELQDNKGKDYRLDILSGDYKGWEISI